MGIDHSDLFEGIPGFGDLSDRDGVPFTHLLLRARQQREWPKLQQCRYSYCYFLNLEQSHIQFYILLLFALLIGILANASIIQPRLKSFIRFQAKYAIYWWVLNGLFSVGHIGLCKGA